LLDCQLVGARRHGEDAIGRRIGFECLSDGIADEFLHRAFHWACAEHLVDASPYEEFKCGFRNGEFKSLLAEAVDFVGNGKLADFPLRVWGKRFEDNLLIEASDEFGAEEGVEFCEDGAFECGEGQASRAKEILRTDVARADDVEARKVVGAMVGESDTGGVEHLEKEIPGQTVRFFDFVEEENAMTMLEKNFSQSSGVASLLAMQVIAGPHEDLLRLLPQRDVTTTGGACDCRLVMIINWS